MKIELSKALIDKIKKDIYETLDKNGKQWETKSGVIYQYLKHIPDSAVSELFSSAKLEKEKGKLIYGHHFILKNLDGRHFCLKNNDIASMEWKVERLGNDYYGYENQISDIINCLKREAKIDSEINWIEKLKKIEKHSTYDSAYELYLNLESNNIPVPNTEEEDGILKNEKMIMYLLRALEDNIDYCTPYFLLSNIFSYTHLEFVKLLKEKLSKLIKQLTDIENQEIHIAR